jgi:uncharacterized membrane protein
MKNWISKPENLFLVIGFIWGVLFLTITPPFQVADEDRHFYRAFQVAEGQWVSFVHENKAGGWLPRSVLRCGSLTTNLRWDQSKKIARENILDQFREPLNLNDRVFVAFRSSAYSPAAYLPSAFLIHLGIWCKVPPIALMYLGRVANLFCWLVLVGISIRIIPFFKWVFLLLALTPMSMYQAASLSADSMTNAMAFLTIAYFLYLSFGPVPEIRRKEFFTLVVLTVLLCLTKNVFFLFFFLFLLIPSRKFSSRKRYLLYFAVLLGLNFLVCLIWSGIVNHLPIDWNPNVKPERQVYHILTHPFAYIRTVIASVVHNWGTFSKGLVGAFGWSFFYLNKWHNRLWVLLIVAVVLNDARREIAIGKWVRALLLSLVIFMAFIIYTLLYIFWCPVGSETIAGVQARYFIPIVPLFLVCLYNRRLIRHFPAKPILLGICSILSLTVALSVIYHRFYVP